jgi:hypothetical protein
MNYQVNPDIPYAVFIKDSKKGVINTTNKQIIIPAKFHSIDIYNSTPEYQSKTNELFYITSYQEKNSIHVRSFLYDVNGKLVYTFGINESIKSSFHYNKKFYFITETIIIIDDFNSPLKKIGEKLIQVNKSNAVKIFSFFSIERLGSKNMISFTDNNQKGYFDLNSNTKILFEDANEIHSSRYVQNLNEVWIKKQDKETRIPNKYYDTVIDSTLTIKPNPIENALIAYDKYFFTENQNGNIEVTYYKGITSPFAYPYILPVRDGFLHNNVHPNYNIFTDKLFAFSSNKEGTLKGIIEAKGKIILPEKFTAINIRSINYYTTPSQEFKTFFEENKLTNFYYFTTKDNNLEDEYAVFNQEGLEIINFRHPKNKDCSPDFDLLEKNRLQIKFNCSDSLKIYDLNTKQLIHSEAKKRY